MLEAAIEAGADDVVSSENGHEVYCEQSALNEVTKTLEERFGEARKSALVWKPQNTIAVDDETAEKLMRLLESLDNHDDVQNVFANFRDDRGKPWPNSPGARKIRPGRCRFSAGSARW